MMRIAARLREKRVKLARLAAAGLVCQALGEALHPQGVSPKVFRP